MKFRLILFVCLVAFFTPARAGKAAARGVIVYCEPPATYRVAAEFVEFTKAAHLSKLIRADGGAEEIPTGGIIGIINYPEVSSSTQDADSAIALIKALLSKTPEREAQAKLQTALTRWMNARALAAQKKPPASVPAAIPENPSRVLVIDGVRYSEVVLTGFVNGVITISHSDGIAKIPAAVLSQAQIAILNATSQTIRIALSAVEPTAKVKESATVVPADGGVVGKPIASPTDIAMARPIAEESAKIAETEPEPSFAIPVKDLPPLTAKRPSSESNTPLYWDQLEDASEAAPFAFTLFPEADASVDGKCYVTLAYETRKSMVVFITSKPLPPGFPVFLDNEILYERTEMGPMVRIAIQTEKDWKALLDAASAYAGLRKMAQQNNLGAGAVKDLAVVGKTRIRFITPNCLQIGHFGLLPKDADEFSKYLTDALKNIRGKVDSATAFTSKTTEAEKNAKAERERAQKLLDGLPERSISK